MAVKIDSNLCGHIDNCPVQGLCIKLCEQGAIIEKDGDVIFIPPKTFSFFNWLKASESDCPSSSQATRATTTPRSQYLNAATY